jgi:hypothetical protein
MSDIKLDLSIEETNLILEALGDMPYRRVYGLVAKLQQQASAQLQPAPEALDEPSETPTRPVLAQASG